MPTPFKRGQLGEGTQVHPAALVAFDEQMSHQRKVLKQLHIQQLREKLLYAPHYPGIELVDQLVAENRLAAKVFTEILELIEHVSLSDERDQVAIGYLKQRLSNALRVID
jgi:hypothetical protein